MLNFLNKILRRISNQKAQHIAEYSLLIVSVMAGILIAGPYVIRSWNALLKSYDTDMRDSFSDPLKQAPSEGGSECDCDEEWRSGDCGEITYQGVTCPYMNRLQYRVCNPFGCGEQTRCLFDSTCCKWEDQGCGIGICAGHDRDMLQKRNCSPDKDPQYDEFRCYQLHPMCSRCKTGYDALGNALPEYHPGIDYKEKICPGDLNIGETDTPQPFYRVPDGSCTDATKCEVECNYEKDGVVYGYIPSKPTPDGHFSTCECEPGKREVCSGIGTARTCICIPCDDSVTVVNGGCQCTGDATGNYEWKYEGFFESDAHDITCENHNIGPISVVANCPPGTKVIAGTCKTYLVGHPNAGFSGVTGSIINGGLSYECRGQANSDGDNSCGDSHRGIMEANATCIPLDFACGCAYQSKDSSCFCRGDSDGGDDPQCYRAHDDPPIRFEQYCGENYQLSATAPCVCNCYDRIDGSSKRTVDLSTPMPYNDDDCEFYEIGKMGNSGCYCVAKSGTTGGSNCKGKTFEIIANCEPISCESNP